MRRVKKFFFLFFSFMWFVPLFAQVDPAWVRRYSGPGVSDDGAAALVLDKSGNVYVTGHCDRDTSVFVNFDYVTLKYTTNGDTLWIRRYDGPVSGGDGGSDIAVDSIGNVYVTGFSDSSSSTDCATFKFASNGDTLWYRRYRGYGYGAGLAVDDSGNVLISGTFFDYAIIKYSPNGDSLWARLYNGTGNGEDHLNDMVVDDSGNVYVTGYSDSDTSFQQNFDYATIKYAPDGDLVWVRRYNGQANLIDNASALAVDDSGNAYVTGYSEGIGTSGDYATVKYKANGDSAWVRRYNGPGNGFDRALALAVDGSENMYVTGFSWSGTNYDYATIKYNSAGDTLWVRRYNGPGNSDDYAYGLAVDGSGNVYVTGSSSGSGTNYDYATIKYSPNGVTLWSIRYNGTANGDDGAVALAVDDSGNVYVTGRSNSGGSSFDYATVKYVPVTCVAKPGDANASSDYSLADVISIVNYIFNKPGCSPLPLCWLTSLLCRGDWDGSTTVTLSDVIRAVNFIFNKPGGPWNPVPVGVCCL